MGKGLNRLLLWLLEAKQESPRYDKTFANKGGRCLARILQGSEKLFKQDQCLMKASRENIIMYAI